MPTLRVMATFDEVGDRHPRLVAGLEVVVLEGLALEGGETDLGHGVFLSSIVRTWQVSSRGSQAPVSCKA